MILSITLDRKKGGIAGSLISYSKALDLIGEKPSIEELSDKLVKYLFAPRNSIDPNEAFRLFRGRDADINALLRARGFPTK